MAERAGIILAAAGESSFRSLGRRVGIDHKQAKKWVARFQDGGMAGIQARTTGPRRGGAGLLRDRLLRLLDAPPPAGRRWCTNAQLAAATGVSEARVETLLSRVVHPHRRRSAWTLAELEDIASEQSRRILAVKPGTEGRGSGMQLHVACGICGRTVWISAHTMIYDRGECASCARRGRGPRRTERMVIDCIEALTGIHFRRNQWPCFLYCHTGKRLEADGLSEGNRIMVEYQGPHHYRPTAYNSKADPRVVQEHHERTREHDRLKREACLAEGWTLVEVHEIRHPVTPAKVRHACVGALATAGVVTVDQANGPTPANA